MTSCSRTMLTCLSSSDQPRPGNAASRPIRDWSRERCYLHRRVKRRLYIPFIREISRMAVLGVPSSASRWISLSATISDVVLDLPCDVSLILGESRCCAELFDRDRCGYLLYRPSHMYPLPVSPAGHSSCEISGRTCLRG
jgi:hypothetical protein